jgi:hypothetical protein
VTSVTLVQARIVCALFKNGCASFDSASSMSPFCGASCSLVLRRSGGLRKHFWLLAVNESEEARESCDGHGLLFVRLHVHDSVYSHMGNGYGLSRLAWSNENKSASTNRILVAVYSISSESRVIITPSR